MIIYNKIRRVVNVVCLVQNLRRVVNVVCLVQNLGEWMEGWMDGRMEGKAGLRIAYSNQKLVNLNCNFFQRPLFSLVEDDKLSGLKSGLKLQSKKLINLNCNFFSESTFSGVRGGRGAFVGRGMGGSTTTNITGTGHQIPKRHTPQKAWPLYVLDEIFRVIFKFFHVLTCFYFLFLLSYAKLG